VAQARTKLGSRGGGAAPGDGSGRPRMTSLPPTAPASQGAGKGRLRILVVNWLDRENPRAGGAELHLHEAFGRLSARGHRVTVLASGWPGCAPTAMLDGMEVHRAGGRETFSWAAPRYHRRFLADRGFDVVVEDLNKVPLFTPWWAGAPVLLLVHHLFGNTAFQAASAPVALATVLLERTIPRVYHGRPVVTVSESTRDDLARRGLVPSRVDVVPNGIDLDHFTPGPEQDRYDGPTLVFVGRLNRYKGVDLVIRALAELAERGRAPRFLVAGSGEERDRLERLAERLGVADRVSLLGYVTEERKLELFRRSWIHVLASEKEGWGLSVLEAAGCATPTIASDAPGLREAVVNGRTGVLVPHGDVGALAGAIDRMLSDPEGRHALGREARRHAERFTWDACADGIACALHRVVAHARLG